MEERVTIQREDSTASVLRDTAVSLIHLSMEGNVSLDFCLIFCLCPGERCEVDSGSGRCVSGVCKNGGRCVNLQVGGFMCRCPDGDFQTAYCEETSRSFTRRSFVTYRGLRQRFHFHLSFRFVTRDRNALLLYNGRFNQKHDFIAVEIIDEQIQLSFSAGENRTSVETFVVGGVSDGEWHTVHLHYYNKPSVRGVRVPLGPSAEKVAVIAVDDCDVEVAIRFGSRIRNYSCAAQRAQTGLKKRCFFVFYIGRVSRSKVKVVMVKAGFLQKTLVSEMEEFVVKSGVLTSLSVSALAFGGKNCEKDETPEPGISMLKA
ncbi:cadherin EGF LAG seven-pass G-type receptor 2-like [Morone saxatilis]|uniref:cadherin EGF LAG seven-pass G-type receptor 2-like n=1 Tax=Morone saxatilis TaxID=34816 RepID=UPI0015E23B34|nr:cadherin EGF LAG seven-pass G-type receptor 2-like [Morone saxatilis]